MRKEVQEGVWEEVLEVHPKCSISFWVSTLSSLASLFSFFFGVTFNGEVAEGTAVDIVYSELLRVDKSAGLDAIC